MKKPAFLLALGLFLVSGFLLLSKDKLVNSFLPHTYLSELDNPILVDSIKKQTGNWDYNFTQPIFLNAPVTKPLAIANEDKNVLGAENGQGEKWIEVNLSNETLYAHEGDKIVYQFLVSTGKWAPTPVGEFRIWIKLRYATMAGGDKAAGDYYYLPNVPYVMYFHNGVGLHGTYWHNNFGSPMSHGCVNLNTADAEKLYWWAEPQVKNNELVTYPTPEDPGTRVVVHD